MAKFISSSRRNPCPICDRIDGDCRTVSDSELILCMHSLDTPPGWQHLGRDSSDLWDKFVPKRDDYDSDRAREYQQKLREQRENERKAKIAKQSKSLTNEARDRAFRKISQIFGLSSKHKQLLLDRGLSEEQIKNGLFFSLSKGENPGYGNSLPSDIPFNLPGINRNGQFYSSVNGFACPFYDLEGNLIGCQIRDDDTNTTSKYTWLKGNFSSHLNNGELPITVVKPNVEKLTDNRPFLNEGSLKPYIAAYRHNVITIGAAGFGFLTSKKQFVKYLEGICDETKEVIFPLDAGLVVNNHLYKKFNQICKYIRKLDYKPLVAWWGQFEKGSGDFDEIESNQYDIITLEELNKLVCKYTQKSEEEVIKSHKNSYKLPGEISREVWLQKFEISPFLQWLSAKAQKINVKAFSRGFGYSPTIVEKLPEIIKFNPHNPLPSKKDYEGKTAPKIIFKNGDRLKVVTQLVGLGWGKIADSSFMGTGKSHGLGLLSPDMDKNNRIFYLDLNHTNVSTPTVRDNFTNLLPRHNGLFRQLDGSLRHKPAFEGQEPEITPNCFQSANFGLLRDKNYDIEGEDNPICAKCPFKGGCSHSSGYGYGYRHLRKETLEKRTIRAFPASLPRDWDYSEDIAIVEESGRLLTGTQTIKGKWEDLSQHFDIIELKLPEVYQQLQAVKLAFMRMTSKEAFRKKKENDNDKKADDETQKEKQGKYGLSFDEIKQYLPEVPTNLSELINLIIPILSPNWDEIVEEPDAVLGLGKKGYLANKEFRKQAKAETADNLINLPTNLLIDILKIWGGEKNGAIRINFDNISITIPDNTHRDLLSRFKAVILLDATPNLKATAQILGVNQGDIIQIEEEKPDLSNLTIVNTNMVGLGSYNVSDVTKARIRSYKDWWLEQDANTQFLGFKGEDWCEKYWFNHNRGTNDFESVKNLVAFGTPFPNIGQIQDDYLALFGNLDGFEDYYNHLVAAEIIQLVGRQRAHRYPNEQFVLNIVASNLDATFDATLLTTLYGLKVVNRDAADFTIAAGSKPQQLKKQILDFGKNLVATGEKLTQDALSKLLGVTQGRVSQALSEFRGGWREFKKLLISLYKGTNRKINNSDSPEIAEWIKNNPLETLKELILVIKTNGWQGLREYLGFLDPEANALLLGALGALFFDTDNRTQLENIKT